jgi:hypothetical protein
MREISRFIGHILLKRIILMVKLVNCRIAPLNKMKNAVLAKRILSAETRIKTIIENYGNDLTILMNMCQRMICLYLQMI